MAKKIKRDYPILIACQIVGYYENDIPKAFDTKKQKVLNPTNIDDKIYIYERQVKDWFLNKASELICNEENGFIVLMICLSYFEGVEQYIRGTESIGPSSKEFFRNAIHRLYPTKFSDDKLNDLYKEARCGLFHSGMVRGKIIINNEFDNSIEFPDEDTILINPVKILFDIKEDFRKYINEIRNPSNTTMRDNFSKMFNII
jgi:hypothetical protein